MAALEYGIVYARDGKDKVLVKAAKANKLPIPKFIEERPTVQVWDDLYWQCFNDLCGDREMVNGLGFIPWTAVNAWAQRQGITDVDEFEMLRYVVGQMDEWWVGHFRKR